MRTLDDIKPGQTIGRYEFLVPIARGGMAAVWAARLKGTRGFAKTVAIKTMLPTLSDDPLFEQMFLDEAQLAAQIHHPNVVEITDLGEESDVLYQVMEYVDGEPLTQVLRALAKAKRRFPIEIVVRVITDACQGLHAAHELKSVDGTRLDLVHRDVSPQNIMVTYDGVVKLVDFGVAKAAGRTASETTAGQIKGKAPYMSPEQALGREIDRRTDIFALGIVLYQIATGKHPFRGESDVATLHNILHIDAPSPRFVDPKFPRPLESVISKSMQRDSAHRFSTAAEMASALQRVFPPTTRPAEVSDVGAFLRDLMGDVGDKRRKALADAIRHADSRTSSASISPDSSSSHFLPLADIHSDVSSVLSGRPIADPTQKIDSVPFSRPSLPGIVPLDAYPRASVPAAPPSQPQSPPSDAQPPAFYTPPESTPFATQAGGAVADLDTPAYSAPPKSRSWLGFVALGTVMLLGGAIGTVAVFKSRTSQATARATPTVSASASEATPAEVVVPTYKVEEFALPAEDPDAASTDAAEDVAIPNGTVGAWTAKPGKSAEPAYSAPKPITNWKPPPVADPGF